ncbi:MAG TPA: hypothetical protein VK603_11915 [Candidatus Saccharimonadales bacterium]|nr:hypothetical protein [Candidatus Saccharimonadales bacterium]
MTKELRQSLENLKCAADISFDLSCKLTELLKLREAVQKAEDAVATRNKRNGTKQTARPGRLFMQTQW